MRADRQEMKDRYYRDASAISELADRARHRMWQAHVNLIEFCDPLRPIKESEEALQDALNIVRGLRADVEREQL